MKKKVVNLNTGYTPPPPPKPVLVAPEVVDRANHVIGSIHYLLAGLTALLMDPENPAAKIPDRLPGPPPLRGRLSAGGLDDALRARIDALARKMDRLEKEF